MKSDKNRSIFETFKAAILQRGRIQILVNARGGSASHAGWQQLEAEVKGALSDEGGFPHLLSSFDGER